MMPFLFNVEAAMPSKAVVANGDRPLVQTLHWGYTGRDHVVFRYQFATTHKADDDATTLNENLPKPMASGDHSKDYFPRT